MRHENGAYAYVHILKGRSKGWVVDRMGLVWFKRLTTKRSRTLEILRSKGNQHCLKVLEWKGRLQAFTCFLRAYRKASQLCSLQYGTYKMIKRNELCSQPQWLLTAETHDMIDNHGLTRQYWNHYQPAVLFLLKNSMYANSYTYTKDSNTM